MVTERKRGTHGKDNSWCLAEASEQKKTALSAGMKKAERVSEVDRIGAFGNRTIGIIFRSSKANHENT